MNVLKIIATCVATMTSVAVSAEIKGTLAEVDQQLLAGDLSQFPEGTKELNGHYYLLVNHKLTWDLAKAWCEKRGGYLATVTSKEEDDLCRKLAEEKLKKKHHGVFLGASDKEKEGQWKWVTGEKFTYQNWIGREPNNRGGNENYLVYMLFNQVGWADVSGAKNGKIGFIIEWEVKEPESPLADAPEHMPEDLKKIHTSIQEKILEASQKGDSETIEKIVKSYGREVVSGLKRAKQNKNKEEYLALQQVKENLITLLGDAKQGDSAKQEDEKVVLRKYQLVNGGKATRLLDVNKKSWKFKNGTYIPVNKNGGRFGVGDFRIGKGDFKISVEMKLSSIGGSHHQFHLGGIVAGVDGGGTRSWMHGDLLGVDVRDGVERKNAKLVKLVGEDEWFLVELAREGDQLALSINGEEQIRKQVDAGELGAFSWRSKKDNVSIKNFTLHGNLKEGLVKSSIIAGHKKPRAYPSTGAQVVKIGKEKLCCAFRTNHWGDKKPQVSFSISEDNGRSWKYLSMAADHKMGKGEPASFALAASDQSKRMSLVFAANTVNPKIFVRNSMTGGKSWQKPLEITKSVKGLGWDVRFKYKALVTSHQKQGGNQTTLIPFAARGDENWKIYMLSSKDGKKWQRSEPLLEDKGGSWQMIELPDGRIWLGSIKEDKKFHYFESKDTGESWGNPQQMTLPTGVRGASLATVISKKKKQRLVFCSPMGTYNHKGKFKANSVNLWTSADQGKSWQNHGRILYNANADTECVSLAPGVVGIRHYFKAWSGNKQRQYRFSDFTFEK